MASFLNSKLFLVSALFLFISFNSFAQFYKQSQADSLTLALTTQKGEERIRTLINISDCYYNIQLDSSQVYATMALKESEQQQFSWGYYKSLSLLAEVGAHNTKISKTVRQLEECIEWFEKNNFFSDALESELIKISNTNIAGSILKGIEETNIVLAKAKEVGDNHLLGRAWDLYVNINVKQFSGNKFQNAIDSSLFFYNKSNDSAAILKVQVEEYRRSYLGKEKTTSFLNEALKRSTKWNHRILKNTILSYLELNYATHSLLDSAKLINQQQLKNIEYYGVSERLLSSIYFHTGYIYYRYHRTPEASIEWFLKSKKITHDLGDLFAEYANTASLARAYARQKKNIESVQYYIEANQIAKQLEHAYYTYATLSNLGKAYTISKKYVEAEESYKQSLAFSQKNLSGRIKDKIVTAAIGNLANLYYDQKRYIEALDLLDTAYSKSIKLNYLTASKYAIQQMKIYIDLDNLEEATLMSSKIQRLFKKNEIFHSDFLLQLGRLHFTQKEWRLSIQALTGFLKKSKQIEISEDRKLAHNLLYKTHVKVGNFKKALDYHVLYKTIDDSIRKANVVENIALIQSKHELSEKEADLLRMKQEGELQALHLKSKNDEISLNRLYILLLSISALLIGLVSYWINSRLRSKKEKKELEMKAEKLLLETENNKVKQEIELAKIKDDLFANVSHEFRTPLTLIQVPLKNYLPKVAQEDQQMFKSVLSNTNQLSVMVDEILELSRMESGDVKLQYTTVNLEEFAKEFEVNFHPLFKNKNISFSIHNSINDKAVEADIKRLRIVINNLLKNAWHHCLEGGEVQLTLSTLGQQKEVLISVSNTKDETLKIESNQIFQRHYRGNNQGYNDSGIGLALSKQIIELHKGTIEIANTDPKRTIFQIKLPLELKHIVSGVPYEEKENQLQKETKKLDFEDHLKEPQSTKKQEVLIVEDNKEIQNLLDSMLSSKFNLHFADDGEQGEKVAINQQPDLIISDIMMPKKDGLELLNALKQNFDTSHIPIILLTARADRESKISGLKQDADEYIAKPFDPEELKVRIDNLLRQRKLLQQRFTQNPFLLAGELKNSPIDADFLARVQDILEKNYDNGDFSVKQFCERLALNRNSVHNKLKAYSSQSTAEFIKKFRLKKAIQLLAEANLSIIEIGERCGFNSPQAFNKAFKENYQLTPSAYRKKLKQ